MNKKILSLIVVLLAMILILLAVCTLYSPHEGGINLLPLNSPPGENTVIVPVTEEDLDRHPALRIALETSEPIVISKLHVYGQRYLLTEIPVHSLEQYLLSGSILQSLKMPHTILPATIHCGPQQPDNRRKTKKK